MSRGTVYPSEAREFRDEKTGVRMRQVTSHPSLHHHPFYYLPAYDDAMHHLIFASHRTGRPELFAEMRDSGKLVQLTEHEGLAEWSIHPSHDGQYVYFTDNSGAWRVSVEDQKEECLSQFADASMREAGMVGAAMGTTTVSRCDKYWAVPVKMGEVSRFHVFDTSSGENEVILERDSIGHPQFHPEDSNLLRYAGPYHERMWVINRDGTGNRLVYQRDIEKKEWIVHETWRPGSMELITANWRRGMIGVDIDSGTVRKVTSFPTWHPMINRKGTLIVTDTTFPDTGIHLFDADDNSGNTRVLCYPNASCQGAHWDVDHCPYDDGTVKVYSPQHTHPHPNFAPDDSLVVFTSDQSGHAQVYECYLSE